MTELNALRSDRGYIKGKLTRFETYINALTDNIDLVEVSERLDKTKTYFDEFNSIQAKIEALSTNAASDVEYANSFENAFYKIISKAKKFLINGQNSARPAHISGDVSGIRLPALDLPQFSGRYEDWLKFHDTFNSLIHINTQLSEIQKFHYLISCIKGDASMVIQSLEVSSSNYRLAWELLKERFDNKRIIVRSHVIGIFNLSQISKVNESNLRSLIDNYKKHIRALNNLGQPTDSWDTLLIYIIANKLDLGTRQDWERTSAEKNFDKIDELIKFLDQKCLLLESVKSSSNQYSDAKDFKYKSQHKVSVNLSNGIECFYCKDAHMLYNCSKFQNLNVKDRISEVKRLNLCFNCLRKGHSKSECKSSNCKHCYKGHNSLLHVQMENTQNTKNIQASSSSNNTSSNHVGFGHSQVLLSTAMIQVADSRGVMHNCRALLDNGSQSNFITRKLCNKLGLDSNKTNITVTGIGQSCSSVNESVNLSFYSNQGTYRAALSCLILPSITNRHPLIEIDCKSLNIPIKLTLADPEFYKPKDIDVLLGASIFWELLAVGQINLGKNQPVMQKTKLGWVISGTLSAHIQQPNRLTQNSSTCHLIRTISDQTLQDDIAKFWEIEEVKVDMQTFKPDICEQHFASNSCRDNTGRFTVKLPFKDNISQIGDSRQMALRRFYSLEKRLAANVNLRTEYHDFMQEYEQLGHMSETSEQYLNSYFLPHHAVLKESSLTTKLRVVFDGSAKSSTNLSLNDCLFVGPVLQNDLFSIIVRFRKYPIVITADIAKMYRQILVHKDDRPLQQILWRYHPSDPVKAYTLNTVTYGTASASYLAIRCLQETARKKLDVYPFASHTILNDFYVDDLITGAYTVDEAIELQNHVTSILKDGGFHLRKWVSNSSEFLERLSESPDVNTLTFAEHENCRTLGLQWVSNSDILKYQLKSIPPSRVTKRSILSAVCQIFDPLGLLCPIIIVAKLLIQQLWQDKIGWDESVSQTLYNSWSQFENSMGFVNKIEIPRFVIQDNATRIELHGFCDASERAYGAAIYIKSYSAKAEITSQLLCAKSRVAPLKTITLAKLELCGALLLSQLTDKVCQALNLNIATKQYYTDSTIVLAWLQARPTQWQTFVANRVSEIQNLTDIKQWKHVKSADNPADHISRGVNAAKLCNLEQWWQGPSWLKTNTVYTENVMLPELNNLPDVRKQKVIICTVVIDSIIDRFSTYLKLQRVLSYVYRFINNSRKGCASHRTYGSLTIKELESTRSRVIRLVQQQSFGPDYEKLKKARELSSTSNIIALDPFLDDNQIIRVGGRLKNSNVTYNRKHPILLPQRHTFTKLIIKHYHVLNLHAPPQLLLSSIRSQFWPICGKSLTKQVCRECVLCFKSRPSILTPKMADLPEARVVPSRPFTNTGLDFAGPFLIRDRTTRGSKLVKCYICLFVCFATKAVHIELVGDLSTNSFIASLRRFISRRGLCTNLYSDNATNFTGAYAELAEMTNLLNKYKGPIDEFLTSRNINWHFIPAKSPHFGGLWEAGIKSIKGHLKRTMGNAHLTYEQFYTVLTQIEACLNSRPLSPLSNDPDDLNPLTPGHFLIGEPLVSLPDHNVMHIKESRLSQFQRCQQLCQHFWKRWQNEYLSTLQNRCKWRTQMSCTNLKPGDLVLLRDDRLPPLKWILGRIIQLHPGNDDVVRVVTVKTNTGVVKRAVTKISPLPCDNSASQI